MAHFMLGVSPGGCRGQLFSEPVGFVTTGIKTGFSTTIDVGIVVNIRFHLSHVVGTITCKVQTKINGSSFLVCFNVGK